MDRYDEGYTDAIHDAANLLAFCLENCVGEERRKIYEKAINNILQLASERNGF